MILIFSPSPYSHYRECEKAETLMRVNNMCFSLIYIPPRVCVFLCLKEGGKEKAGGDSANPYTLWRIQGHSFMFCQPPVKQFPIKALLNSAVIPITASQVHLTVSRVLKHLTLSSLWSAPQCPTCLVRPNQLLSGSVVILEDMSDHTMCCCSFHLSYFIRCRSHLIVFEAYPSLCSFINPASPTDPLHFLFIIS